VRSSVSRDALRCASRLNFAASNAGVRGYGVGRIRVLVVDDSVVARKLIGGLLADDPGIELVGTAPNGRIALHRIDQLGPDVVLLDVEMPELDGLQTLRAIRERWPRLAVVMFSRATQRGCSVTLEALALGASGYIAKPVEGGEAALSELGPAVLAGVRRAASLSSGSSPGLSPLGAARGPVEVVVVGVSTGGPNALAELVAGLPAAFPVPILIVQHIPAAFIRLLVKRLNGLGTLPVVAAGDGMVAQPGTVYLCPGERHLEVERAGLDLVLRVTDGPPENSCRPSVDVLFRSAAVAVGPGALAVVLTGMGSDGLKGVAALRERGGNTIVQDEATSVVWGMPGAVAQAGLADLTLPLGEIAAAVARRVRRTRSASGTPVN
jgi:two-component system chemotaxis response regulator CheB